GRRTTYSLLSTVVIVTVLLRYPLSLGHEAGSDTTFIHSLAYSVIVHCRALWILNPTSYFGLYALSYPSGSPFLLSSVSITSGIEIEGAVLFDDVVFSIAGALAAFLASRKITNDDRLGLWVSL